MNSVLTYMMQSGSAIEWAGAIGAMLAGVGSLAAAFVALYLARDAQKIKFCAYCTIPEDTTPEDYRSGTEDRFLLFLENRSNRSVDVNRIALKIGKQYISPHDIVAWWLDAENYPAHDPTPDSTKLPKVLGSGEYFKWDLSMHGVASFFVRFRKVQTERDAKKLRFVVHTGSGRQKIIKPKTPVVDAIIKVLHDNIR